MMKEYTCRRGDFSIYCRAYIPDNGKDKHTTVIMCNGFNGIYKGNIKYAEILEKAGIASFLFDFCGGAMESRSDGEMIDMSVMTEKADLNTVINFVLNLDFIDKDNVFLMGKSQGGLVSALTAAEHSDSINGLILLYPAFGIPDAAKRFSSENVQIPESIKILGGIIGKKYYYDAVNLDVFGSIGGYQNKALIIHGDSDDLVPLDYSRRALNVYSDADLKVLPGAGHGFHNSDVALAGKYMVDFINSCTM